MTARISVVVPCYNHERYLGETIDSLLKQTLDAWELVVVDDGSPGDVAAAIGHRLSDPRIRLVRQPNGGLCRARNTGYRYRSSDSAYVLFFDSDDILEPHMLEILIGYLDRHTDVGMAFCDRTLIDGDGRPIDPYRDDVIRRYVRSRLGARLRQQDYPETPFESFFAYNIAVPSLMVLRRSVYDAAGGWDERLGPMSEDTDLWLRVTLQSRAHYLPYKLVRRRLHGNQLTRSISGETRRQQGLRRFEEKWAVGDWLSPAERATVAAAARFKNRRVLPSLWFSWSLERLLRGELLEAAKCWLRGIRLLAPGRLGSKSSRPALGRTN